ncbi:hypothetical protein CBR14_22975, partial [Cronobacter sakazakii]
LLVFSFSYPYTVAQFRQLSSVTRTLLFLYPAFKSHMTGHSDISPERKTYPVPAFDCPRFRALLSDPSVLLLSFRFSPFCCCFS